jgi:uncharacterized alkaline shock family protein YloU
MTELVRTDLGRIDVSASALRLAVARTAEEIGCVRVRRTRRSPIVEIGDGAARVELAVAVRSGTIVPVAAREVQERVGEVVGAMLEVRVTAVDVSVDRIYR